ncbi:hypothetical protein [Streptomyces mirabilis]|uniref:hypothetical protein n=1 Tax=Streptomyces mirabilis TaxID=68239 RepID=UPI0033B01BB9
MHVSGVILLFTFLIPPAWALDAYGAAPADDPTADVPPFMILAALLFACVGFHLVVQIPSGLLGTWLGRNRGGLVTYAIALVIAGTLTALVLGAVLHLESARAFMGLWADFMLRGSLGLVGYVVVSCVLLRQRRVRSV